MNDDTQATAPSDPEMFTPLTTDENGILWAHLNSGWYKQAAVYPGLSEPWQETIGCSSTCSRRASRPGKPGEPEAGQ